MGSQKRSALVLAVTTLSLATFGCMGTGVMGSGADSSPTPAQSGTPTPGSSATPTPSGTPAMVCTIIWANSSGANLDIYEVDVDASLWVTGTIQLDGQKASASYLLGVNQSTGTFNTAGVATAGSFSLTANGTTVGSQASFNDTASLTFFDGTAALKGQATALGAQSATGGAGTFSGALSNLNGTPTPGTGTVTVKVGNTNMTFGTLAAIAGCGTPPGP